MKPEHKILHQKFRHYGQNAKEWMRKCVLLLPKIEHCRIWKQKGFGSIYEYAAKLAGMSRNTVDDALRILRKIEDKLELQKVVETKGINAVRPVASIATSETAKFWAEKAMEMSKNTLEVYVKELRKFEISSHELPNIENTNNAEARTSEAWPQEVSRTSTGNNAKNTHQQAIHDFDSLAASQLLFPQKITLIMQLDPQIANQLQKLKGSGDWNELMQELLKIRSAQLQAQKPEPVQTSARHIPIEIQRHVLAKTNGTCAFPGCKKPYQILHHTQRFALEKIHDPNRLEPLCKSHERLAHLGLIENENLPASEWSIRQKADENAATYVIDRLVSKYRSFAPP
ncbi:MAG: hypothetical protein AAB588_01115 [Patescibacteria group bacterium]